jgi:hypothetical protein
MFSNNTWTTTVPISGSDEIFLTGLAFPVTSGLPGGGISPVWSGIFSSSVPGGIRAVAMGCGRLHVLAGSSWRLQHA